MVGVLKNNEETTLYAVNSRISGSKKVARKQRICNSTLDVVT
jgi:hypothetical protein